MLREQTIVLKHMSLAQSHTLEYACQLEQVCSPHFLSTLLMYRMMDLTVEIIIVSALQKALESPCQPRESCDPDATIGGKLANTHNPFQRSLTAV